MKAERKMTRTEPNASLPLGISSSAGYYNFVVFLPGTKACELHIYDLWNAEATVPLSLFAQDTMPGFFAGRIAQEALPQCFGYRYAVEGQEFLDPYVKYTVGRETFGVRGQCYGVAGEAVACACHAGAPVEKYRPFAWGQDTPPRLAYEDMILYKLHVRGFSMAAPGVRHKGTYRGLLEKKDYLLELGINALLLLPCVEFDECADADGNYNSIPSYARVPQGMASARAEAKPRVNYWGFAKESSYFAPKASYASKPHQAASEFKEMVAGMHASGIEVLLEMDFKAADNPNMIRDCLVWWVQEYHVDGFRYNTEFFPARVAALCPELSGVKILSAGFGDVEGIRRVTGFGAMVAPQAAVPGKGTWNAFAGHGAWEAPGEKTVLAEYNEGFLREIRRFVKGDEEMVGAVAARLERQTGSVGTINYLADHNGFTLADVYAYDVKHNEENGEENRDGTDYNFSWNCGVEGATKKKKILKLRSQMRRNALLLLFVSLGTPMLLAGDEFGNTQGGNNNAYCQDNAVGWVSWKELRTNKDQFEFVRQLIALRKAHPVLRGKRPLRGTDYISCGCPDVSRHGTKAWYPDYSNYSRTLAVLFCGKYAMLDEKTPDQSIYIAANMHWEPHTFDLPDIHDGEELEFLLCSDIDCTATGKRTFEVPPRSVALFVGKETKKAAGEEGAAEGKKKAGGEIAAQKTDTAEETVESGKGMAQEKRQDEGDKWEKKTETGKKRKRSRKET